MSPNSIPNTARIAISAAGLGITLFLIFLLYSAHITMTQRDVAFSRVLTVDPTTIEARAAIVYDPTERSILFQKNASASLPLASLTKLMAVWAVLSSGKSDSQVVITPEDLKPSGDWGFLAGDVVKLSDLIKMSLVASSNDAMAAAAASLGDGYLNQMNRTAGELGLSNTYFLNPTGLDLSEETSGAYGSAYDIARLAAAFLKQYPEYFELTAQERVSIPDGNRVLSATSTALPLSGIPGFIGAKTGYTDLAGGNLVAAFDLDIGHPLILVVLGSSENGRFTDIETLMNASRLTLAATSTPL